MSLLRRLYLDHSRAYAEVCNKRSVPADSVLWLISRLSFRLHCPYLFRAAAKVYPLGIPVLYATILWDKRDLLNPRICSDTKPDCDGDDEADMREISARESKGPTETRNTPSKCQTKNGLTPHILQELDEKVKARREHPELIPSMFLWKDFGEDRKRGCTLPQT